MATIAEILARLQSALPERPFGVHAGPMPILVVEPADLLEVMRTLRDDPELAFDYLSDLTPVDQIYFDEIDVNYVLFSLRHRHSLTVKVRVDRDDAALPSLVPLWRGANFQEREAYDMFGIRFLGHPNLTRILTWDDFPGHALRKDFAINEPALIPRNRVRLDYPGAPSLVPPAQEP
ncbi:MAG: NADH-quinone oxidoreductase subunit C [Chloroflexi bacterium]|nr:NADH-quinone oxidoreductase subunit C [Chloroflexota bacterium]